MTDRYAIGVDLGGTNIKFVAVDERGLVFERRCAGTEDLGSAWAHRVAGAVIELEGAHGPAHGVGVSSPGLAAADRRSIVWMQGRMNGLQGFDWTAYLRRARTVPVLNDAHAALIGETWMGAAAGVRHVVMLTLGTGVGGAALVDGRLLRGHLGRAGHLGHISVDAEGVPDIVGTPGSLEDAIGDCTVSARSDGRFTSTEQLVAAYRVGDPWARHVWERSIQRLAVGLASLVNVLDPEVVVIGGGIAGAGDALFEPLRRQLERVEWRPLGTGVALVPAALGEFAGALGAAHHVFHDEAM